MQPIFSFLAAIVGIYSLLIFIRIILSWFGDTHDVKPVFILRSITDPYLDFWRSKLNIRLGFLDLSPLVGIVALSIAQTILVALSRHQKITIGSILSVILLSLWSIVSFLLGICIIILILRLIAFITNRDIYTPFWRMINGISQPILFKFNRLFFGDKIVSFAKSLYFALLLLFVVWLSGKLLIPLLASFLSGFPI